MTRIFFVCELEHGSGAELGSLKMVILSRDEFWTTGAVQARQYNLGNVYHFKDAHLACVWNCKILSALCRVVAKMCNLGMFSILFVVYCDCKYVQNENQEKQNVLCALFCWWFCDLQMLTLGRVCRKACGQWKSTELQGVLTYFLLFINRRSWSSKLLIRDWQASSKRPK